MIAVQIDGKTFFMTIDEWLNMSKEQYQDLVASGGGLDVDDPFGKEINKILRSVKEEPQDPWDLPDIDEELRKMDKNNKSGKEEIT